VTIIKLLKIVNLKVMKNIKQAMFD